MVKPATLTVVSIVTFLIDILLKTAVLPLPGTTPPCQLEVSDQLLSPPEPIHVKLAGVLNSQP